MKKSRFILCLLCAAALSGFAACAGKNVPAPESVPAETRAEAAPAQTSELLSRHDVVAEFAGTREHVCLGRTALCPDRCGDSGTLAVFRVLRYESYEKPGEYGDPQTGEFVFMLKSTAGTSDVSDEIARAVGRLSPGNKVRLVWEHVYVTDENGSQFPERPVVRLEKISGEDAAR